MLDQPSLALAEHLKRAQQSKNLLIADENTLGVFSDFGEQADLSVISNRFDVYQNLQQSGLSCVFGDFDFSSIADSSLDTVFYRISKEKPVVHHVINQAAQKLKPGGQLIFCGYKADGTKSYFDKAKKLWHGSAALKKNGNNYTATLTLDLPPSSTLDCKNYTQLRPCISINANSYLSKPGLFGWEKVDVGSQLLINTLPDILEDPSRKITSLLDLGCGYGYLTLATRHLNLDYRCATDNNAAALQACSANFDLANLAVDTVAADCAANINRKFDLILCNPPFHQGFSVDGDLTDKFLRSIHRLLDDDGVAVLVVNQFLPLERKAKELQFNCTALSLDGSFKVVALTKNSVK